ncbi:MAG: type II restriction endonuclease [Verrucomicrobia bacterium]|nr:type II restriction endonuclease [Verrucomicrobiota bacterium]
MLSIKNKLLTIKTDKDKKYYKNLCNTLELKIDSIVYDLYKLNHSERKIIENNSHF